MARTDPKASERSRRAYLKRKHIAQAEMAGAEILDVTLAARSADGHFVIRLYDDTTLHLDLRGELAPIADVAKAVKIYAPKSWEPDKWNAFVDSIKSQHATKETVIDQVTESTVLDERRKRQTLKLVESLPDAPDWYDSLPLAPVE